MKTRFLKEEDFYKYEEDIVDCYMDNLQIMDSQSCLDITNRDILSDYVLGLISSKESSIEGIFNDKEEYLYGMIVYDGMRFSNDGNAAQLHLAVCKDLWGKVIFNMCNQILERTYFDTLYCMIPSYCRPTIALVKKLGFKKTGYIPKALPYKNIKGEEKMYDELIYTWSKSNGKIQK